jgi:hypothetical protein
VAAICEIAAAAVPVLEIATALAALAVLSA